MISEVSETAQAQEYNQQIVEYYSITENLVRRLSEVVKVSATPVFVNSTENKKIERIAR